MPSYTYILGGGGGSGGGSGGGGTTVYGVVQVDHVALGLARLIKQYRGDRPRLQGALQAYLEGVQSIEDVAMDVLVGRWPLTAVGVQLDMLGRIVLEERAGDGDDVYRMRILVRILSNRSNGRVEDLNGILALIGGFDHLQVREVYPASLEVYLAGTDYTGLTLVALFRAKGGGVKLQVISTEDTWDETLKFYSEYSPAAGSVTNGWGSEYDAAIPGGLWACCYAEVLR